MRNRRNPRNSSDDESNSDKNGVEDENFDDDTGKPLKLVEFHKGDSIQESFQLLLHLKNLDAVLQTCKNKSLCVISICGPARSGKSFLLNQIKNYLAALEDDEEENWISRNKTVAGFPWKHGYHPQTEGIWIWSRAFQINRADVLLLDTQGMHDFTTPEEISTLLGLSSLLSSITIVNCMGDIPQELFGWLDNLVKFGNLTGKKGDAKPFQKLSFVVRDWIRLSDHQWGTSPGGSQYLNSVLDRIPNLEKKLKKVWDELDCCLLPHIGSKAVLRSFTGNPTDLDNEFSKRIVSLVSDMVNGDNLPTKHILGNVISPAEYRTFLISFINLFNNKLEMEAGIRGESILQCTLKAAEQIKTKNGLVQYHQIFKDHIQSSHDTFLKDVTIETLHVSASQTAIQHFRSLRVPTEIEAILQKKFQRILESEKEKLKMNNEGDRRQKIENSATNAKDAFSAKLQQLFPFTSSPSQPVPDNRVFYNGKQLVQEGKELIKLAREEFMEEFADEDDEDETREMSSHINSALNPILQSYIEKNEQNFERAETFARDITSDFLDEYKTYLEDKIQRAPKMDADLLKIFHEDKLVEIEKKFSDIKLGTLEFQERFLEDLQEGIEREHVEKKLSLEHTWASAIKMIEQQKKNYVADLKQKAEEVDNEDEMKEFHDISQVAIANKFKLNCPIPTNTEKGKDLLERLNASLDESFTEILEENVIRRKQIEDTFKEESQHTVGKLKNVIENELNNQEFLEDAEFEMFINEQSDIAIATFNSNTENLEIDLSKKNDFIAELMTKLKNVEDTFRAENHERHNSAINKAASVSAAILKKYKEKMSAILMETDTLEQLQENHAILSSQFAEDFENQLPCRNLAFVTGALQDIDKNAYKIYSGLQEAFNRMKTTDEITTTHAQFQAKSDYDDSMNQHFTAVDKFYSETELKILDEQARKFALGKLDPGISPAQKSKVEEVLKNACEFFVQKNDTIKKSFELDDVAIGIDLGTTYCCVAIFKHGKLQTVRNNLSGDIIPSYVRIEEDGTKVFGSTAKASAYESPETTIYDAKRLIGRRWDEADVQKDLEIWPFTVENNDGPKIIVNEQEFSPEEISGFLLEHLKDEAAKTLNLEIKKAVITVPAYFTDSQRLATKQAGEFWTSWQL